MLISTTHSKPVSVFIWRSESGRLMAFANEDQLMGNVTYNDRPNLEVYRSSELSRHYDNFPEYKPPQGLI